MLALVTVSAVAAPPLPGWVETSPLAAARPARLAQTDDGAYDLVFDTQVRVEPGISTTVLRSARKLLDRKGVEQAARLSFEFDPSREKVLIYRIVVVRNGVSTDRLAGADIETIQRERKLDDGIVTGLKTVVVQLRDIRPGDIVDYSVGWETRSPQWPNHYFASFDSSWSVPIGFARVRVDYPATMALIFSAPHTVPAPWHGLASNRRHFEWSATDPEPLTADDQHPPWFTSWAQIRVSTMRDWHAVAEWARPLYADKDRLPPAFAAEVDAIATASADPAERAARALRLVQGAVRYMSMSVGDGGWVPRLPAQTIANGWGDCKDKAVLLTAALRRLGIAAWPALTDIDQGPALPDLPPSPNIFGHVIVLAQIGGRNWWLDPTSEPQGGPLSGLAPLTYGFALPIRAGQTGLIPIPAPLPDRPTVSVVETYRVPADAASPLTLDVVSTYRADGADQMRGTIASQSLADLARNYLNYYRDKYPGLEPVHPPVFDDSAATGIITVTEAYRLPPAARIAKGLDKRFLVYSSAIDGIYKTPPSGGRTAPLWLGDTGWRTHRIIIETPGRAPPMPAEEHINSKGFDYGLVSRRDGDRLTLDWHLRARATSIQPRDVEAFRADVASYLDNRGWYLDLTSRDGGTMNGGGGTPAVSRAIGILIFFLTGLGLSIWGVRAAFRTDAARGEAQTLVPVGPVKFGIMSVATAGLYALLWTWRCWRWVRLHDRDDVRPLWRAMFGVIFLWPLFKTANARAVPPLAPALGTIAAIVCPLISVAGVAAAQLARGQWWPTLAGTVVQTLVLLPVLAAVNRANRGNGVEAANSSIDGLGVIGAVVGIGLQLLIFVK